MQIKMPRFHDAQRGCFCVLQSAQMRLDGSLTRDFKVARLASTRSWAGSARRDIMNCRVQKSDEGRSCLNPMSFYEAER